MPTDAREGAGSGTAESPTRSTAAKARLDGRTAIVTGGASGIGLAIAHALAAEGASVVIGDRNTDNARTAASQITAIGGTALAVSADVTVEEEVGALIDETASTFGQIDILVNNAGLSLVKPFLENTIDDFDRMYAVHVRGTALCSFAAAPHMIERRYGRIINISSGGALGSSSHFATAYQTAKAAQGYLGNCMALGLGDYGITVNTVVPDVVATPLWDTIGEGFQRVAGRTAAEEIAHRASTHRLGRALDASEIARVVVFLALPDSEAISAQTIRVG